MPGAVDASTCPFEPPLTVRELRPPVEAEPPRRGEGGLPCSGCAVPDGECLWLDDRWRLRAKDPTSFRGTVILETRDHYDTFSDLPRQHLLELGPLISAVERALLDLGGVGRVHVSRWGDGTAHFHLFFYARPFGQLQLRGTFMAIWELVLPALPAKEVEQTGSAIGRAVEVRLRR